MSPIRVSVKQMLGVLGPETVVLGSHDVIISQVKPAEEADDMSLVWMRTQPKDINSFIAENPAPLFILPLPAPEGLNVPVAKTVVFVNDSRLAAVTILASFFRNRPAWGAHPTAVIHPEAEIHPETYVGPNTFVGRCSIGKGSILYGNNYLYDGVKLGNDVTVHAGTVIGADGFGYQPGEDKEWLKFEHTGGVVIGNGVEIGANTCIDRGALGDTVIRDGTKIDNLVHIAHNVQIGRHCLVIAHAMIGGSCVIGDHAWIAPNAGIIQKTSIGPGATVGLGAVVLEQVPAGETWAGVPARKIGQTNKKPE
ncbi:MAG: UDP-3-O-(3-hydroxymyristoyl)glucosamine N-acyltransferase [Chitinophagaceae bacterium]